MQKMDDKKAFAARLRQALKRSSKKVETATELAIQFSLRHPGTALTPQAAQKWLTGKARPTPDKIETLAHWLNVSPTWLRYGVADQVRPQSSLTRPTPGLTLAESRPLAPTPEESVLLQRLRAMPEARRRLVFDVVEQFALEGEAWAASQPFER